MTNTWKTGTAEDLLKYPNGYVWVEFTDPTNRELVSISLSMAATEIVCSSGEHRSILLTSGYVFPNVRNYFIPIDLKIRYSDDWEL